jgi:hypothetical protein
MNQITLEYLRKIRDEAESIQKLQAQEAGETGDTEMWDASRITLGEIFLINDLLAYMQGFNYRERLMAIKKGTL